MKFLFFKRLAPLWFSIFILVLCVGQSACSPKQEFEIRKLTVREMPPGREVAAAYMQIENFSDEALVFNFVHSPVAESVEVHEHVYEDGKMKMRPVRLLSLLSNLMTAQRTRK